MLGGLGFAEEITREGVEELMQECQYQRQQNIAPLKEKAMPEAMAISLRCPRLEGFIIVTLMSPHRLFLR